VQKPTAILCTLTLLACAVLAQPAFAELSNEGLLGFGARTRPAYDGSETQRVEPVPVLRYFGPIAFVRSTLGVLEGGGRIALASGLHAGAQIAYEAGRSANEADFLQYHGVPDIHRGASFGAHLEWDHLFDPVPVSLLLRARRNFDSRLGTQIDLRASVGVFQAGPFGAGLFAQTTWADASATRAYYGVTREQSPVFGLPTYEPGPGLLYTGFGLLGGLELSSSWMIVGSPETRRVRGGAERSPMVERATAYYVSLGICIGL
jgi:MipA family protein